MGSLESMGFSMHSQAGAWERGKNRSQPIEISGINSQKFYQKSLNQAYQPLR